jgi:hypothetical protein
MRVVCLANINNGICNFYVYQIALNTVVVVQPIPGRKWPHFTLLGGLSKETSKDKFTALSFSHEGVLPALSLVTSSELGLVKLWSIGSRSVVKLHEAHKVGKHIFTSSPILYSYLIKV